MTRTRQSGRKSTGGKAPRPSTGIKSGIQAGLSGRSQGEHPNAMPSSLNPDVLDRVETNLAANSKTILQVKQTAGESSGSRIPRRQPRVLGPVGGSTTWGQLGGEAVSLVASQDHAMIPRRVAAERLESADAAITDTQTQTQPQPRTKQTARKSSGRRPSQSFRSSSSGGRHISGEESMISCVNPPSPPPLSVILSHMVSMRYRPVSIPMPEDAAQHAVGEVGEAERGPGPARKRLRKSTGGMPPPAQVQGQSQEAGLGPGLTQRTGDTRAGEGFPMSPWDTGLSSMPTTGLAGGSSRQYEQTSGAPSAHALPSAASAGLGGRKRQTARKRTGGRAPLITGSGAQGPWRSR